MAPPDPIARMHKARAARCTTRRATIDIQRDDIEHDKLKNR